jgi:hypothetical protein
MLIPFLIITNAALLRELPAVSFDLLHKYKKWLKNVSKNDERGFSRIKHVILS